MPTPKPMIQGTLGGGTSLADVLNVVSTSRQWLEVVLEDESRILCKSGQVLDVFAPPDRSGVEAFHSLLHQPRGAYSVYRREPPEDGGEPLGALCQLLAIRAPHVVLEGRFEHFRIREVLEVLSIGRQTMKLVATRSDGSEVVLHTRAGRLLSCEAPESSGVDAFHGLLADPGERFRVTRSAATPAEPLGRIAALMAGPAEVEAAQDVVLDGSLADTPIRDVLTMLGLTRQLVELVLRDERGTRGTILAKAGRLLDARSTRTDRRGRDAFVELVRDPGRSFVVRRRGERQLKEPLGTVAELTDQALAATPVLQGRFQDTSIVELLEVVGLSRQLMEIALAGERGPVGQLLVKAGCIVSAWRGGKLGRDAFRAILRDPGKTFRVTRSEVRVTGEPLGTIAEWIRAERSEPPGLRQLVLEGKFAGVGVGEVLGSVSLSRQHLVMLFRSRGKARGRVAVKAGRVLEAAHAGLRGVEAVQSLLDDPGESYVVYRMPAGSPLPEPIGTIDELLGDGGAVTEIELPAPESSRKEPDLEARLGELSAAIGSLERAITAQQRTWLGVAALFAVLLLVQILFGR